MEWEGKEEEEGGRGGRKEGRKEGREKDGRKEKERKRKGSKKAEIKKKERSQWHKESNEAVGDWKVGVVRPLIFIHYCSQRDKNNNRAGLTYTMSSLLSFPPPPFFTPSHSNFTLFLTLRVFLHTLVYATKNKTKTDSWTSSRPPGPSMTQKRQPHQLISLPDPTCPGNYAYSLLFFLK
jgi:hypothetical protein